MIHRITLIILYFLTICALIYLAYEGGVYYQLSLADRPHSPLHDSYKPSGIIGHGLGIIGSILMLVLLLYSARKRLRFMQQLGNIRYWLNYHIWMGITGPLLVVFHTAFKLGGIVSVSFWSMIAVALSGVLGRYIYIQIPRTMTGQELSPADLERMDREFQDVLMNKFGLNEDILRLINAASDERAASAKDGFSGLLFWLMQDLSLSGRLSSVRRSIRDDARLNRHEIAQVTTIIKRKIKLRRRAAFLSTAHSLLHHWHVLHKPFAMVMLIIMVIHVIVAVIFGYTWIFNA